MDNSLQKNQTVNVGDTLDDRYVLKSLIGRGGCGLVFCATDLNLQRDVAIKVLSGEGIIEHDMLKRFEQESQILRRLHSANTVYFYDCGETIYHQPYIVMEYVTGQQLKSVLEKEKKLSPKRTVAILTQVLSALYEAHCFGFIHRDLKPSNIMLCKRPGFPDDFVKVLDFGIAKVITDDETAASKPDVAGTPRYMPPEQFKNEPLSPASDLYSIGCIAYEMLTGISPFDGDSLHVIVAKHLFMTPPPMGAEFDQYPNLVSTIFKLLEKKPSTRFASAQEVIHILEHWEDPELIPEMLDYAVPVEEEEFSLEESFETIPLQLPPDFARRLANMPMSGPIAIKFKKEMTMGTDSNNQKLRPISADSDLLEPEDSIEKTHYDVPSMESPCCDDDRLSTITSQFKLSALFRNFTQGQKKYLIIAVAITLALLIAVIFIIIIKVTKEDAPINHKAVTASEQTTQSESTEKANESKVNAPDDSNSLKDPPKDPSNDAKQDNDSNEQNTENNDIPPKEDSADSKELADSDNPDKVQEESPKQDASDKSKSTADKKTGKHTKEYPIFSFTLEYTPKHAKVTFTNAEGNCSKGKCTIQTTSKVKPATIVVFANGYAKRTLVIKKESSTYTVNLKPDKKSIDRSTF